MTFRGPGETLLGVLGEHDLVDVDDVMATPDHSIKLLCSLRPPFSLRRRVLRLPFLGDLDALLLDFLLAVNTTKDADRHDLRLELLLK